MVKINPNDECPCLSGKKYKKCCRPYHENQSKPVPEALARARFAAYALGHIDFIMETTHPESPHVNQNKVRWRAELEAYSLRNVFAEFKVLSAEDDKVTYQATLMEFRVQEHRYIEDARFKQVDGKWLYFDGDMKDVADNEAEETA
jgi:SEC-C motif domain protein